MKSGAILAVAALAGLLAFSIRLIAFDPPPEPARRSRGLASTQRAAIPDDLRALSAAQRGEFSRAVELQSAACREEPQRHQQWRALALYQHSAGLHEAARLAWSTAASLLQDAARDDRDDAFWLAEYYERSGRPDDARRIALEQARSLERALASAREPDANALYHLGWANRRLGDEDAARHAWQRCADAPFILFSPTGNPSASYNRACHLALAGLADKALDMLEAAVEAGWRDPYWARHDRDLEPIREHPRFDEILSRISVNRRPPALGF